MGVPLPALQIRNLGSEKLSKLFKVIPITKHLDIKMCYYFPAVEPLCLYPELQRGTHRTGYSALVSVYVRL